MQWYLKFNKKGDCKQTLPIIQEKELVIGSVEVFDYKVAISAVYLPVFL